MFSIMRAMNMDQSCQRYSHARCVKILLRLKTTSRRVHVRRQMRTEIVAYPFIIDRHF